MRALLAACTFSLPLQLSLRSCRHTVCMATNRNEPPPTKTAAVEAALAARHAQPVILLARPFAPGNIGAVARAMLNFGLSDLRLVAPLTENWLTEEAQARACGAAPLLDEAQTFADMPAATDDLQLVLATTARPRDANVPVLTPRAAAELAAAAVASGQRVGLLFGSEKNGLDNDELLCANRLVTVPTNPQFSSLNLAQAVLLLCYEYGAAVASQQQALPPPAPPPLPPRPMPCARVARAPWLQEGEGSPVRRKGYGERESSWREAPAPMGMVRSLLDAWEDGLWRHGFFGARCRNDRPQRHSTRQGLTAPGLAAHAIVSAALGPTRLGCSTAWSRHPGCLNGHVCLACVCRRALGEWQASSDSASSIATAATMQQLESSV